MTRKYLNDRWCVRCNRQGPAPYVRDNIKKIGIDLSEDGLKNSIVLDIGCGNGRNTRYLRGLGFPNVIALDMAGDFGTKCVLGVDPVPLEAQSANLILCNFLLMFLSDEERGFVIEEIKRVAASNCVIMVELYPAKDSFAKDKLDMEIMLDAIYESLGWEKIRYARSSGKFIAKNKTARN